MDNVELWWLVWSSILLTIIASNQIILTATAIMLWQSRKTGLGRDGLTRKSRTSNMFHKETGKLANGPTPQPANIGPLMGFLKQKTTSPPTKTKTVGEIVQEINSASGRSSRRVYGPADMAPNFQTPEKGKK